MWWPKRQNKEKEVKIRRTRSIMRVLKYTHEISSFGIRIMKMIIMTLVIMNELLTICLISCSKHFTVSPMTVT